MEISTAHDCILLQATLTPTEEKPCKKSYRFIYLSQMTNVFFIRKQEIKQI